jgi:DNA-binding NtrC family response regulator
MRFTVSRGAAFWGRIALQKGSAGGCAFNARALFFQATRLRNALKRSTRAFLFTGLSGTGKTMAAEVIARISTKEK